MKIPIKQLATPIKMEKLKCSFMTVGLNETETGTINKSEASKNLLKLINDLKYGAVLFIFVLEM